MTEGHKTGSEAAADWVAIGSIRPWDRNPRRNDDAVSAVVKSIQRFGFASPIIARRADGVIIAGHTRYKAAQQLGMDKVLVRFLDLDPGEAIALAVADNKIGEIAEWDSTMLAEVLRDLQAEDVDTEGLGFTDDELAAIIKGAEAVGDDEWGEALGALPEGDRAPIQSMTFTLHDDQAATVKEAMERAKGMGPFVDTGNENGNGNALARICEMFLGMDHG